MSWALARLEDLGPKVDLGDFIAPSGVTVTLRLRHREGDELLDESDWDGDVRELRRYRLEGGVWQALDRTRFTLDDEHFTEREQYRARGGANLHREPIRIPRRLILGRWERPFGRGGGRLSLAFHGRVRLDTAVGTSEHRAIAILGAENGQRRLQWSLAGIGEVALGPPRKAPERWALSARIGGVSAFGDTQDDTFDFARGELPSATEAEPRRGIF